MTEKPSEIKWKQSDIDKTAIVFAKAKKTYYADFYLKNGFSNSVLDNEPNFEKNKLEDMNYVRKLKCEMSKNATCIGVIDSFELKQ